MRAFAAGFFALVALSMAALLVPFLRPASLRQTIALPFLAAACAYGWAWLLHPRDEAPTYGPLRGALVALLAYLSFAAILVASGFRDIGLLIIIGFVWVPFPWFALAAGALAGGANLRRIRSRFETSSAAVRRLSTSAAAALRSVYERLDERVSHPRADARIAWGVGGCLLFAGAALGFAWLDPKSAVTDATDGVSQRLLPGIVALILAAAGWVCGRALLRAVPAAYRLPILSASLLLAGVAAIAFWVKVVA